MHIENILTWILWVLTDASLQTEASLVADVAVLIVGDGIVERAIISVLVKAWNWIRTIKTDRETQQA